MAGAVGGQQPINQALQQDTMMLLLLRKGTRKSKKNHLDVEQKKILYIQATSIAIYSRSPDRSSGLDEV